MLLMDAINHHAKKKTQGEPLMQTEGVICSKCNTSYRKVPLIGKCTSCGAELEFYFGENRSKYFAPMQ